MGVESKMASNTNHGTPLEDLAGNRAQGCLKVFLQRDYSEGTSVKFQTKFPPELEGKIEKSVFENTINDINGLFVEAEKMSCGRYCEGCLGCLTAYLVFFCMETHYEQMLKKVSKYVMDANERAWSPRGLHLTSPI